MRTAGATPTSAALMAPGLTSTGPWHLEGAAGQQGTELQLVHTVLSRHPRGGHHLHAARHVSFRYGAEVVRAILSDPTPSVPSGRLSGTKGTAAKGWPLRPGVSTMAGGAVRINCVPSQPGRHGRVEIDTGFIRAVVIQKWRPNRGELTDFLDVNIAVTGALPLPVTGLLAPRTWRRCRRPAAAAAPRRRRQRCSGPAAGVTECSSGRAAVRQEARRPALTSLDLAFLVVLLQPAQQPSSRYAAAEAMRHKPS
ncbi:hypothetical protein ABPG75_006253 [Micractinium tetrahymenae]